MSNRLQHEFLIALFRANPDLAVILLRDHLGVEVPSFAYAKFESQDEVEITVGQSVRRADAVILHYRNRFTIDRAFAVVVEVQRFQDTDEAYWWLVFHAVMRARHHCPTYLLVLCPDQKTAEWARLPIDMGQPQCEFIPIASTLKELGIDIEGVRLMPELAVLAAIAHADEEDSAEYFDELARQLAGLDPNRRRLYADGVLDSVGQAARTEWQRTMLMASRKYKSDFFNGLYAEGRMEGKAEVILRVLPARGLTVSDAQKARISDCTDEELLDLWIDRAATCESVDELFV
jgi:hypothetical protein